MGYRIVDFVYSKYAIGLLAMLTQWSPFNGMPISWKMFQSSDESVQKHKCGDLLCEHHRQSTHWSKKKRFNKIIWWIMVHQQCAAM